MSRFLGVRGGAAVVVGVAVLGLSGCGGQPLVDAKSAQKAVTETVAENTKFTTTEVKCPSGIEAKVDVTFDCTYRASDGEDYVAHLTITEVKDSKVSFSISAVAA